MHKFGKGEKTDKDAAGVTMSKLVANIGQIQRLFAQHKASKGDVEEASALDTKALGNVEMALNLAERETKIDHFYCGKLYELAGNLKFTAKELSDAAMCYAQAKHHFLKAGAKDREENLRADLAQVIKEMYPNPLANIQHYELFKVILLFRIVLIWYPDASKILSKYIFIGKGYDYGTE